MVPPRYGTSFISQVWKDKIQRIAEFPTCDVIAATLYMRKTLRASHFPNLRREREAFRTLKFLSRETCRQPAVFHMHDLLDRSAVSEKAVRTTLQHIIMAWPIGVHSRGKHQTAAVVVGPNIVISPNFWCKSGENICVFLLHTCSPAAYDSSQLRNCHYF